MLFSLFTILLVVACDSSDSTPSVRLTATPLSQVALRAVQDCESLTRTYIDNRVEQLLSQQRYGPDILFEDVVFADNATSGDAEAASSSAPDDVSQTNIQEAGVDEADSVKADSMGNLYVARDDQLLVVDAFPPDEMSIIATLELDGAIDGLYLSDDEQHIVALLSPRIEYLDSPVVDEATIETASSSYYPNIAQTRVVLIDVSAPTAPVVEREIQIDGSLIASRRIESSLYLVQEFYLDQGENLYDSEVQSLLESYFDAYQQRDSDLQDEIRAELRQRIETLIETGTIAELLPEVRIVEGENTAQTSILPCNGVYAPDVALNQNQLLTVTRIGLDEQRVEQTAIIGSGWITYVSAEDLFVVQPGSNWWWDREQTEQSAIHHFSIGESGPAYRSTGLVDGYVLNSFSLSYHQDHLRVATTQNLWGLQDRSDISSTNHLFVLRDIQNLGMNVVGSVEGYANQERIYSARFVGERGYVVTFRQVDPLFSFDLSDPAQPRIAGELKIPGFSTYMHPIGDNHLLTIGRDGDEFGVGNAVAVKLFDVSNLSAPLLIDSYTPNPGNGYSWSEANWNHHAFTYYAPLSLLAIPVSGYSYASDQYRASIVALNVDLEQGLSLAGSVNHHDLVQGVSCPTQASYCDDFYLDYLAQPTRSLLMTDDSHAFLFSLSNIGIKAIETTDFNTVVGCIRFAL
jgi:uncharacterized secreted protein with C-terminal beta-propeller domain